MLFSKTYKRSARQQQSGQVHLNVDLDTKIYCDRYIARIGYQPPSEDEDNNTKLFKNGLWYKLCEPTSLDDNDVYNIVNAGDHISNISKIGVTRLVPYGEHFKYTYYDDYVNTDYDNIRNTWTEQEGFLPYIYCFYYLYDYRNYTGNQPIDHPRNLRLHELATYIDQLNVYTIADISDRKLTNHNMHKFYGTNGGGVINTIAGFKIGETATLNNVISINNYTSNNTADMLSMSYLKGCMSNMDAETFGTNAWRGSVSRPLTRTDLYTPTMTQEELTTRPKIAILDCFTNERVYNASDLSQYAHLQCLIIASYKQIPERNISQ